MKKLIGILLALAMLASLTVPAFADDPDYTTGTPWPDIDLDGVVTADTETSLKDNFALYVNKDNILALEIPEGYPYGGTVISVVLQNAEDIKNMFLGDAPEGHDAMLAYNLFGLMMDWDSRNALGVAPLKEEIDAAEAIDSLDALTAYFLDTPVEDMVGPLWGSGSMAGFTDSSHNIILVSDCGLLLGDSAEYSALTDYGKIKKDAYTELAQKMLVKLGYSEDEAAKKIENCFAFETDFAPVVYTTQEKGSADYISRINNVITRDELAAAQGKLPILDYIKNLGYPEAEQYLVTNPAFLKRMNELYTEENLPLIRDYMIVHKAVGASSALDRECYEWYNDCNNAISGSTGILPDEVVFSSAVAGMLEWPVAQLYTQTYLKQEEKDRIGAMVDEILNAYHGIINEADFLSDATKAAAIEKLEAIQKRVLFPDSWEKYSCEELEIPSAKDGGTYWQAAKDVALYTVAKLVKEYPEPVDKEKWSATPQTVNCFYDPQDNSISIMGAFAQGGLYNSAMSDEELFATLGGVIGHEISHAFDRSGAQFDKDGNMTNWWTEDDYNAFLARNAKMENYYNNMHPWEGQDFYGSIMTGEACADMAGLKVMLLLAKDKENFDYDAFFRAFANVWLDKDTLQEAYTRINDNHPMCYLRVNCTLQQFDEFLDFYGITEGDGMYLAPADRVAIW